MALVTLHDISIRYRGPALLDDISCQIEPGQRIGLLGRNGAGKSTLMKIMSGQVQPDNGTVQFAKGASVAILRQDVPQDVVGSIRDVIQRDTDTRSDSGQVRIDKTLSRMDLNPHDDFATLSSGTKRRVL